jgi:hypothetical protein
VKSFNIQGDLTSQFHFHHPNCKFSELLTLLEGRGGGGGGDKEERNLIVSFISWKRQLKKSKLWCPENPARKHLVYGLSKCVGDAKPQGWSSLFIWYIVNGHYKGTRATHSKCQTFSLTFWKQKASTLSSATCYIQALAILLSALLIIIDIHHHWETVLWVTVHISRGRQTVLRVCSSSPIINHYYHHQASCLITQAPVMIASFAE